LDNVHSAGLRFKEEIAGKGKRKGKFAYCWQSSLIQRGGGRREEGGGGRQTDHKTERRWRE
jgi:hypothetical protein